jgi:hypothetical protein
VARIWSSLPTHCTRVSLPPPKAAPSCNISIVAISYFLKWKEFQFIDLQEIEKQLQKSYLQ